MIIEKESPAEGDKYETRMGKPQRRGRDSQRERKAGPPRESAGHASRQPRTALWPALGCCCSESKGPRPGTGLALQTDWRQKEEGSGSHTGQSLSPGTGAAGSRSGRGPKSPGRHTLHGQTFAAPLGGEIQFQKAAGRGLYQSLKCAKQQNTLIVGTHACVFNTYADSGMTYANSRQGDFWVGDSRRGGGRREKGVGPGQSL